MKLIGEFGNCGTQLDGSRYFRSLACCGVILWEAGAGVWAFLETEIHKRVWREQYRSAVRTTEYRKGVVAGWETFFS